MNLGKEHEFFPYQTPDWKVCGARARNCPRSSGVVYIFSIKFCQFRPLILQTFQSGSDQLDSINTFPSNLLTVDIFSNLLKI